MDETLYKYLAEYWMRRCNEYKAECLKAAAILTKIVYSSGIEDKEKDGK